MNECRKKNNGEIIYHYTSWAAFEKILRNKSLRLSDLQSMNDSKESIHFLKIFEQKICSMLCEANLEEKIPEARKIISQVKEDVYINRAYALCFSKLNDDAAQWERYGQMGRGVCLAFNKCELKRQIKELGFSRIQEVFYLESLDEHKHLEIFFEFLSEGRSREFKSLEDWTSNLLATASAFKHESFETEREVRLVSLPLSSNLKQLLKQGTAKIEYVAKEDRLRSYIEINLPHLEKCIDKIIVGPRSSQDRDELTNIVTEWKCQNLLARDCIYMSECPLR